MNQDQQIAKNIALMKTFQNKNGRRAKGIIDYKKTTPIKERLQKKLTERRIEKLTGKSIAEIRAMYLKNQIELDLNVNETPKGLLDSWSRNEIIYKEEEEEKKE